LGAYDYWPGALYASDKYYRSSENSLMRADGAKYTKIGSTIYSYSSAKNLQLEPVNLYHIVSSYKTRIGDIKSIDPDVEVYVNNEWPNYSFFEFSKQYPPTWFD
jgi:hypothetical protein